MLVKLFDKYIQYIYIYTLVNTPIYGEFGDGGSHMLY